VIRRSWYAWGAAALAAAAFLLMPLVIFGLAVLRTEGSVRLSALIAEEEMTGAVRTASLREVWGAGVFYVNFARGSLNAQIYRLTVGQLALSTVLGALLGLNLAASQRARRLHGAGTRAGCGLGAGGGALATVGSATAGALGCCGGSATVGLVTSLGVSVPLAGVLGEAAWAVQLAIIAFLAAYLVRTHRRLPALAPRPPA
jgi:hypothetical protein